MEQTAAANPKAPPTSLFLSQPCSFTIQLSERTSKPVNEKRPSSLPVCLLFSLSQPVRQFAERVRGGRGSLGPQSPQTATELAAGVEPRRSVAPDDHASKLHLKGSVAPSVQWPGNQLVGPIPYFHPTRLAVPAAAGGNSLSS